MPVSPLQVFFVFFLRGEVILHFFRFGSDFGPVFFLVGWFHFQVFGRRSEFCR